MTKNRTQWISTRAREEAARNRKRNGNREALAIETSPDELDRIQNANDRDYAMGNLERTSSRLGEVRAALRRIAAGTFGICDGCEENINLKRLAAVPWTVLLYRLPGGGGSRAGHASDRDGDAAHGGLNNSLQEKTICFGH